MQKTKNQEIYEGIGDNGQKYYLRVSITYKYLLVFVDFNVTLYYNFNELL